MLGRRATPAMLALLLAGVGALAACGGGDDGGSGDASGSGSDDGGMASDGDGPSGDVPDDVVVVDGTQATVQALDNTFRDPDIQVQPGTTVTWTNDGRNEHDVLPVEGDDWGVEVEAFQPGATYQHTFTDPGVYDYYCSIHGTTTEGMVGAVVVGE